MNIFTESLLLVLGIQIMFFALAYLLQTDKVTDVSYAMSFFVTAVFVLIRTGHLLPVHILLLMLIFAWSARLGTYLFVRIIKTKRDKRFDRIRDSFMKFALFWVFQGVSVWIILLPSILVLSMSNVLVERVSLLGLFVSYLGLAIETVADYQKFVFKNNPKNKDKWIASGLWKYARHPNYFGEMLVWWGVFVFVFPYLSGPGFTVVVGPIFITVLLRFISGIPPLEKRYALKYKSNRDYLKYKNSTHLLVPLPKF
ncbi:DUF1295 domain-containing protein [Candidatus Microgenomates bacterium]|nr:MAG: DUF1295 domain-containing protein [Candidatus Microgenomates bacterium]